MGTGEAFKDTKKNKVFLWLHEWFWGLSQWFINRCDMEPLDLTQANWTKLLEDIRVKDE